MFDSFDREINYLRISVTDRCNLRCSYCMPPEGVPLLHHGDILTFDEIEGVVREAVALGMNKFRLTGGEPLVRKDIVALVRQLAGVHGVDELCLTTNGTFLASYAADLKHAGLSRINVSLDTVDPEAFSALTCGGRLDDVLQGIEAARAAGFLNTKINCVVEQSENEPHALGVAAFGRRSGLEVRYIPRMETKTGRFGRVLGGEGGNCAGCNRLRLSSDGFVYACLFSDQSWAVRKYGARDALIMACRHKPEAGKESSLAFNRIGG